jgi:hypothetical protein
MALNIKVEWGAAQKMFRFNQEMTIFEVCKQIREKLNIEGIGSDHGLFQPAEGARMGRWLKPERTLMFYDMKSNVRMTFFLVTELLLTEPSNVNRISSSTRRNTER